MQDEETTIRLSDCFEDDGVEPCVEVVARMININYGKNKELMEHCKPLMDYAIFVKKVRDYTKDVSLEIAVNRAIDECIEEDRLKEFLEQHRAEVVDIMLDSYSLENYTKIMEYEKEHLAKEMQDLQEELEDLQGEYQGLQGKVEGLQGECQGLQGEEEDLQGENQNLKGQKQELEENYKNSIIAMVQMALEFYDNETDAIRKTAEKCHMSVEQVTELWDADRKL